MDDPVLDDLAVNLLAAMPPAPGMLLGKIWSDHTAQHGVPSPETSEAQVTPAMSLLRAGLVTVNGAGPLWAVTEAGGLFCLVLSRPWVAVRSLEPQPLSKKRKAIHRWIGVIDRLVANGSQLILTIRWVLKNDQPAPDVIEEIRVVELTQRKVSAVAGDDHAMNLPLGATGNDFEVSAPGGEVAALLTEAGFDLRSAGAR